MDVFKLLIQKARTWRKLSHQERSLLLEALILLPLVALSLKLGGLKRTQSLLIKLLPSSPSFPFPPCSPLLTTVNMVQIATKYHNPWTTCLKKSLVLWYLLRRQGITAQLQIGVRQEQGEFQAHAWVEYQGYVIGDRQEVKQHFTAFGGLENWV